MKPGDFIALKLPTSWLRGLRTQKPKIKLRYGFHDWQKRIIAVSDDPSFQGYHFVVGRWR